MATDAEGTARRRGASDGSKKWAKGVACNVKPPTRSEIPTFYGMI